MCLSEANDKKIKPKAKPKATQIQNVKNLGQNLIPLSKGRILLVTTAGYIKAII